MKNLSIHIEKLLLNHDCVIIPEFGGFVANYEPANCIEKSIFTPPARKIGFNIHLTYNDGLLAQSIMKTESCSYEQAIKLIAEERNYLQNLLLREKEAVIGKIGTLHSNADNQLCFEPNETENFAPQYYGLTPVECYPLQKTLTKKYVFPAFTRNIAAAAALVLVLLPANLLDNSSQQASVLPIPWGNITPQDDKLVVENKLLAEEPLSTDTLLFEKTQEALIPEEQEPDIVYWEEFFPEKTYHIIIASLPSKRLANQYLQEIESFAFSGISIVESNNRFRISLKEFFDENTAMRFLKAFKRNYSNFSDAWIYHKF